MLLPCIYAQFLSHLSVHLLSSTLNLGIWATCKHNKSVEISEKLALVCFESFGKVHLSRQWRHCAYCRPCTFCLLCFFMIFPRSILQLYKRNCQLVQLIIEEDDPFHFAVPAPTMTLSSSIPSPIPPFSGSDVTLTCAVELSPAVDVPVTVNTVLNRPEGFMPASIAQPVMGSSTNYTSTFLISSFGRSNSGLYSCRATVRLRSTNAYISSSTASHSVRITTGIR